MSSQLQASSLGTIEVAVDVPDDVPPVELDRGQIQQVLVNLTRNAIDAVDGSGGRRIGVTQFARGERAAMSGS